MKRMKAKVIHVAQAVGELDGANSLDVDDCDAYVILKGFE